MKTEQLYMEAFHLLGNLIRIPSFSKEEDRTADLLAQFMQLHGLEINRKGNNTWSRNKNYNGLKPTLLLNSHHDTVRPNGKWDTNPLSPVQKGEKLFGLGVNDAGASLVSMLMAFLHYYEAELPFNIVFAATAEEEISGSGGIESIYRNLGKIDFAIVGEPTQMDVAVGEKGLLVLDCIAHGVSGHAAREEGENAILNAMCDIQWFSTYHFEKTSQWLGPVKMSVTMISAGTQHNVIPATCNFTVDVRVTDAYTLNEVLDEIKKHVRCEVQPRSVRLQPSGISNAHPLVLAAKSLGKRLYGSPTSSDQALIPAPSVKMGPGDSARSHTANEFIYLHELRDGITGYIRFIGTLAEIISNDNFLITPHETLDERNK